MSIFSLLESLQTLFWTGFGEVGVDSFDLAGINSYTRFWALLMFAAYSVMNVTVLLNLLIAMMSNSYSVIADQADVEWKFSRTKLWINFFEEKSTLPSPYNAMPTKKMLTAIISYIKRNTRRYEKTEKDSVPKNQNCSENKFSQVTQALVWRYISAKHRESEMKSITEDHIQEIRGDISSLKCHLQEVLEKCDIRTYSNENTEKMLNKKLRMWERQLTRDFHIGPVKKEQDETDINEKLEKVTEDFKFARDMGKEIEAGNENKIEVQKKERKS